MYPQTKSAKAPCVPDFGAIADLCYVTFLQAQWLAETLQAGRKCRPETMRRSARTMRATPQESGPLGRWWSTRLCRRVQRWVSGRFGAAGANNFATLDAESRRRRNGDVLRERLMLADCAMLAIVTAGRRAERNRRQPSVRRGFSSCHRLFRSGFRGRLEGRMVVRMAAPMPVGTGRRLAGSGRICFVGHAACATVGQEMQPLPAGGNNAVAGQKQSDSDTTKQHVTMGGRKQAAIQLQLA